MTLTPGTSLGPHEILAPIGAGGMGEVYRARDTRLNRVVAIKVLPEHSTTAETKQRFEREAQTIAALNHPHICTLYDVGHQDGIDFLVMEYLEGESLADRLARGPLPLDDVLKYAAQIADALDKAHRQGIVHRDLKPGNIMLTKSGAKLLDFGLARLRRPTATPAFTVSSVPTERSGLTLQGTILGTLQYMAPEQLEGREADSRTDIFAFGAVLYEAITGKRAFEGKSHVSIIGAILEREPAPVSTLQPASPRAVDLVLAKCLAKDPADRWQSAGDLGTALQSILGEPRGASATERSKPGSARSSKVWFLVSAVLLLTATVLASVLIYEHRSPPEAAVMRFYVSAPNKTIFDSGVSAGNNGFTGGSISPDGRKLTFTARDESTRVMLWVRSLDTLSARLLPGTEGAALPFWSPDGKSIGFFTINGKLKKIDFDGGVVQTICDAANARGGAWSPHGFIVFAAANTAGLIRVSSAGGEPVPATKLLAGQQSHRFPAFLPDGKHFLYFATENPGGAAIYAGSTDSVEGQRLLAADAPAVYASPGYVLFVRQGTLLAQSFDPIKLQLIGEPAPVAEQVAYDGPGAAYSASGNGILAYRTGVTSNGLTLTLVDRSGKVLGTPGAGRYLGPDISPDGKQVAMHRHDGTGGDVWTLDLSSGKTSRLTFEAAQENSSPLWSPDGSQIVFASQRNGKWGIYQKSSSGIGGEQLLTESDLMTTPTSWSADGKIILYIVIGSKTGADIWALPLTGDRKPFAVLQTPFIESHPQISPDGKWFAYQSNETGRSEVYVQTFPPGGGKWQVSSSGGVFARWRPDGKELFFMETPNFGKIVSTEIRATASTFAFSAPRMLFDSEYINSSFGHATQWNTFAVFPDGQRFILTRPDASLTALNANTPITVVLNWPASLKK